MRKNVANIQEWCQHTRNANGYGRRGVNKRIRLAYRLELTKEWEQWLTDCIEEAYERRYGSSGW